MLIVGDIKLAGVTDPTKPFSKIRSVLQGHSVVYGNLEGALYDKIDSYEHFSKIGWIHPGTKGAGALKEGNFSAVGLANNVIVGAEAIESTISLLDSMGIAHTGAGMNLAEACAPAIVEKAGVRYGFLQRTSIFWPYRHRAVPAGPFKLPSRKYGHGLFRAGDTMVFHGAPGVATIRPRTAYEPSYTSIFEAGGAAIIHTWPDEEDLASFVEDIRALRQRVDIVVASVHWRITTGPGNPPEILARDFRVETAHAAVDAGADIVASHGTHYIDEIEVYKDRPIFYGLGELYFGNEKGVTRPERPPVTKVKLAAEVEVTNKAVSSVRCRPLISGGWPTDNGGQDECVFRRPSEEPEAIARLLKISERFGTSLTIGPDAIEVI